MKKIISKIKGLFLIISMAIITFPSKVLAVNLEDVQILYGPYEEINTYETPVWVQNVWKVAKNTIVPIVLLIGIIVYFKKGKSPLKEKIMVIIMLILIAVMLYLMLNKVIMN